MIGTIFVVAIFIFLGVYVYLDVREKAPVKEDPYELHKELNPNVCYVCGRKPFEVTKVKKWYRGSMRSFCGSCYDSTWYN